MRKYYGLILLCVLVYMTMFTNDCNLVEAAPNLREEMYYAHEGYISEEPGYYPTGSGFRMIVLVIGAAAIVYGWFKNGAIYEVSVLLGGAALGLYAFAKWMIPFYDSCASKLYPTIITLVLGYAYIFALSLIASYVDDLFRKK